MADTILLNCKICEKEFDSIPEIDKQICDDCADDRANTQEVEQ